MMDVGVLCTRVRLEEKRLIAALAAAGGNGLPLSPTDLPLPLQPLATDLVSGDGTKAEPTILIDRLADRSIARLLTPFWQASARTLIGAGRAAVLDRLEIARLLADANLPRPQT
ncbi:MAG TPA: hypothetical protein PK819_11475, partial [Thermomicrobiales bacterium]|nr:hypothetical protein [Thermomicrobiales bacterium]